MRPFLPPVFLSLVILVTAPVMGEIRDFIFRHFPSSGVRALGLGFALLAAMIFLAAIIRIREHRYARYASLLACALLVGILIHGFDTESARVNVVERVHILEYGLLSLLLYRVFRPRGDLSLLLLPLIWVACAGALDEFVQWFFQKRVGEIRDVALNAFSGAAGLFFALALIPPRGLRLRFAEGSLPWLSRSAALLLLTLGLFFTVAHLGTMIEDPEIGRFRSFFDAQRLAELSRKRQESWASQPPTGLDPWAREDYFLTEAGAHANHRGERHQAGDAYMTWQANRILEKYYSPFLEIESFRGSGKHRFPEAVKAELQARLPVRDPARYLSPVHEKRIHTWIGVPAFLGILIPLALVIFLLPELAEVARQQR